MGRVTHTKATDLPSLTSLRFFAALAVFSYHVGFVSWLPHDVVLRYGYAGVEFFFILSGFVLTWSLRPGSPRGGFYIRRVARVYPLYALTTLGALIVGRSAFAQPSAINITTNLALLQSWFPAGHGIASLNPVSWSLSCEAFFYAITPFLVAALRKRNTSSMVMLCALWAASAWSLALVWGPAGSGGDDDAYINPLARSGGFVVGVLLALLVQRGWRGPLPLSACVLGVAAVGVGISVIDVQLPSVVVDVALAPFFALLILGAALADLRPTATPRRRLLTNRYLVLGGQISFAFYLVHLTVISNVLRVTEHFRMEVPGVALTIIALILGQAAAALLHRCVEKPAQRKLLTIWSTYTSGGSLRRAAAP